MHILLFGPVPPPHGGVQTHLMALRAHLLGAGHQVSVINITRHRKVEGDGFFYPASAAALLSRVAGLRPDIMHVHLGGNLGRRDLLLCLALTAFPAPVVMTFHSGGYPTSPAGLNARPRTLAGFVLRRLAGVIGVNAEIARTFERYGVLPSRIAVIEPDAVDLGGVDVDGVLPASLAQFAASHDPFLVTVSGLEPEYSVELQVDSMPAVRQALPGAGLAILGSGSLEEQVKARIASSPARDHILLCGDMPHEVTLRAIRRAAVMLRPTWYDGDSVSVREALAIGTRVLASDTAMRPPGVHKLAALDEASLVRGLQDVLAIPASDPSRQDPGVALGQVLALYKRLLPQ